MVRQVQIVSILMIVNGALIAVMGLFYAIGLPALIATGVLSDNRPPRPEDSTVQAIVAGVIMGCGVLILAIAILNIIGGIRCRQFRGRGLCLVALFSTVLVMPTVYCAPTSIGVMVYGLVVFFNEDVARAFRRAKEGATAEEILEQRWDSPDDEDMEEWERRPRHWDDGRRDD